jgi:Secretion system C-terminal sorting domain/FG-GAP-like repeat
MSTFGYSQILNFNLANPQPNLIQVYGGSFASGDIDGDGDKDLLVTGTSPTILTKLYLNDGTGVFTETANPFPLATSTVTIFKDLDGDGDLDLFFSGNSNTGVAFTNIYSNNGFGIFTLVSNPVLPKFTGSGAAIADVDNDGDQDIVISAQTSTSAFVADVYKNNGSAIFTAQSGTTFTPVKFASVAFIDMENNGDKDVIISGKDASNVSSIKIYQNDGSGNYTLNSNSTFLPISADDVDVADTDNDGDVDFLVSGSRAGSIANTILYTNNGSGVFTATSTSLQNTFAGKSAFADLDNDGDQDVLVGGSQAGGLPNIYSIVYSNTGNNVFVAADTIGGEYITDCVIDNFNGDVLKDIITQGFLSRMTKVFWNIATVLPIQFNSFTAQSSYNCETIIKLNTGAEDNVSKIEIEHSINGTSFTPIHKFIPIGSNSSYSYVHSTPSFGKNLYRIMSTDRDGRTQKSEIVQSANTCNALMEVYPNPVRNEIFIKGFQNEERVTIQLFDVTGKLIMQQTFNRNSVISMELGKIASGQYTLRASTEANSFETKVLKL